MTTVLLVCAVAISAFGAACAPRQRPRSPLTHERRVAAIRKASVWRPTHVASMNLRVGPRSVKGFAFNALVDCTYLQRDMTGRTPKFTCRLPDGDEVKVKYGRRNGEVYAEVAATRLLWGLGFGADAMFPVRIRCHGCPPEMREEEEASPVKAGAHEPIQIDIAAIERKMPGVELVDGDGGGWTWPELRLLPGRAAGEMRTHRDALTLLAAMLQHTDSKREQQRLICLDPVVTGKLHAGGEQCRRPFMLISDLGKTFGRANTFNRDGPGSVNLDAWRRVSVWLGSHGCRANLSPSATGTLENPVIAEPGRRLLARLLEQLTHRQLVDLFTIARFTTRVDATGAVGHGEVADWVGVFRDKVRQVSERSCDANREGH